MSDATTGDLKLLLEQAAVRDDRRHEANVEWRTRMDSAVKTLTDQVAVVSQRQDAQERRLDRHEHELSLAAGRSSEAIDTAAELEGKLIGSVNGMAVRFAEKLAAQDKEIAHIRSETDKQMPILSKLQEYMAGQVATSKFLRWAIPLTGGAVITIVPAMWWLFHALQSVH